ncbi:MAG: hypothetical protein H6799_02145 [Candidatus Nomurabacteria bacterium]|nr:MAG: hypothetical protein H6799_02145 [Candidatus Nomurabacteria bacterium]HRV76248.1 hypothetical protein [Candidatus Saccharimonadales bacterium]
MIDVLMVGFAVMYALSAYLRKSTIGGAVFGLYAGLFFNTQYNSSFVTWISRHGVEGDASFLNAAVALFFILFPTILALLNFRSSRGHLVLRLGLSILLGVLTGYYVGIVLGSTSSLNGLSTGPIYDFVESFITPIGVVAMGLGMADIVMGKSKKAKEE